MSLSAGSPAYPESYILTPKPGPSPKINGPVVYGVRPGRPFLYRIPCTGQRPIRFSAGGLPASLSLNAGTGVITGKAPTQPGKYAVQFGATNSVGRSTRQFTIIVGDTIALTPPMGWNDWYTHYDRVTDKLMREAADAMIASGMADFGYQYVNIDDCWMVKPELDRSGDRRRAPRPQRRNPPNRRFPDMKALTDYIHAKGLKAGIYTSPGPLTCAQFAGCCQHEEADASTFADWGFDFLKYDWCSYRKVCRRQDARSSQAALPLMGGSQRAGSRHRVQPLPVRHGRRLEVGRGGRRPLLAHHRRSGPGEGTRLPGFYSIGINNAEHARVRRPRPVERSRLHSDRPCGNARMMLRRRRPL